MLVKLTPLTSVTAHSISLSDCEKLILCHLAESVMNVAMP